MKNLNQSLLIIVVILTSALTAFAVLKLEPQPAFAATNMAPTAKYTVLNVNCTSVANFSNTYVKIADFGAFQVANPDSVVEATFHGRVSADTISGSSGAYFELRVDDQASNMGRARATVRAGDYSVSHGVPVSMSGVFTGLAAGSHTVSIWVRAGGSGSGTGGRVDPGCWSSDHIVVRETLPFGSTYLPTIVK